MSIPTEVNPLLDEASEQGSITRLIAQVRSADSDATARIWQRYYEQLVRLARQKLRSTSRRVADEEDVVVDAFDSFCRGVQEGRFPRLNDRDDLWQILMVLTERKAINQFVHGNRQKRGGGVVRGESAFGSADREKYGINQIAGADPTPEFAELVSEEYGRLLAVLGDKVLQEIAVAKMEGYQNAEIATRLGVQPRTIERKLRLIREIWSQNETSPE